MYLGYHRHILVHLAGGLGIRPAEEKRWQAFLQTASERVHKGKVERGFKVEYLLVFKLQLFAEIIHRRRTKLAGKLHADRGKFLALFQQLRHDLAQVYVVVVESLLHVDVGVSGYAHKGFVQYFVVLENKRHIVEYKLFHKHEASLASRKEDNS